MRETSVQTSGGIRPQRAGGWTTFRIAYRIRIVVVRSRQRCRATTLRLQTGKAAQQVEERPDCGYRPKAPLAAPPRARRHTCELAKPYGPGRSRDHPSYRNAPQNRISIRRLGIAARGPTNPYIPRGGDVSLTADIERQIASPGKVSSPFRDPKALKTTTSMS